MRRLLDSFGYRGMELPEILVQALRADISAIWTAGETSPMRSVSFWDIRPRMCPALSKTEEKISSVPGYWKVYKDPARARRIFDGYDRGQGGGHPYGGKRDRDRDIIKYTS